MAETTDLQRLYDERYSRGYREHLTGYEIARWHALDHFLSSEIATVEKLGRVLDYGSGSGLHVPLWEDLFPESELHFCDISRVALERLADTYPHHAGRCHLVKGARSCLGDASFDLVVSVEVMEHVKDISAYLADVHRVLKPGGSFVWTTPCGNRISIEHVYAALTGQIEKTVEGYRRWSWEDPAHLRRLRSGEIKALLDALGFRDIRFRFRAHLFSFICTRSFTRHLGRFRDKAMLLDYGLFRWFPNGASMIGRASKT